MPRIHLTERAIAALPAPDSSGKQVLYWDTGLKGLGVLVSGTSPSKSYVVQRGKRITFSPVAEMTLIAAKARAVELLVDLKRGVDPGKKVERNVTLGATLESYLASRHDLRPASVRVYRQIERYLAPSMNAPLRNISADAVEKKHREIAANHGEVTANVTMRTLRALWGHASERTPDLPPNPVVRLKRQWFKEKRRVRMLSEEQLPVFYSAVCALDNAIVRDLILLLMFSGLRHGEASRLRWENVDLNKRTITLPASSTKSGRELALPVSDIVADMLIARRALGCDEFVFPGNGKTGHVSDLQRPFTAIAKATGITISPHDLRRGFITVAESIGTPLTVIKALVGHAPSRDVTSGYVVLSTDRMREPVQRIAVRLQELCGIRIRQAAT
jgi:integrase